MQESGQVIRSDMAGIAREVEENAALFHEDRAAFDQIFSAVVTLRAVPSALHHRLQGRRSFLRLLGRYRSIAPHLRTTSPGRPEGRIVPLSWDLSNGVAALKKLSGFSDAYLYAVRPVNPNVFRLLQRTQYNIILFRPA